MGVIMEYISVPIMYLLLDVQRKTGLQVTNARLNGGRWQVYHDDGSFLGNPWRDLSELLKGEI